MKYLLSIFLLLQSFIFHVKHDNYTGKQNTNTEAVQNPPLNFPKVVFDYKVSDLDKNMLDSLRYVIKAMNRNAKLIVMINGHASQNEGTNKEKLLLSEKRCMVCLKYFISQGIDSSRFKTKAWGDSLPTKGSDKEEIHRLATKEERDAAYAKNRRVQFELIKNEYSYK